MGRRWKRVKGACKRWVRRKIVKPVSRVVRNLLCGCVCPVEGEDITDVMWAHALSLEEDSIRKIVKMVECNGGTMTLSSHQETDAPPRKRSKLSLSSRRKDESSVSAVTSKQESVYPLFKPKGAESSSVSEKMDSTFVESDSSAVPDTPAEPSSSVSMVMDSYRCGEFIPFVGLTNLHNTCYMNSVLQVLIHTPQFALKLVYLRQDLREIVTETKEQNKNTVRLQFSKPEFCLLNDLVKLFQKVGTLKLNYILNPGKHDDTLVIEPIKALDAIRDVNSMFAGSLQHDAQELLRSLLSSLQDANTSILTYQAKRREELRCRQEKLAIILAEKEAKKAAALPVVKYSRDLRPENGVLQNGHSNGVVVKQPSEEKASKLSKKKRLGMGHARNQMKITKFASPNEAVSSTVNGHNENGAVANGHANGDVGKDDSTKEHSSNGATDAYAHVDGSLAEQVSGVKLDEKTVKTASTDVEMDTTPSLNGSVADRHAQTDTPPTGNGSVANSHAQMDTTPASNGSVANGHAQMDTAPSVNGSVANGQVQMKTTPAANGSVANGHAQTDTPPSVNESVVNGHAHMKNGDSRKEDSEELDKLLELTEKELLFLQKEEPPNIIEEVFQGQLLYETSCLECEIKTARTESFQDLSLPVKMNKQQDQPEETKGDTSKEKKEDDKADVLSLSWSFETFMAAEKLDGENKYRCEYCGSESEAIRNIYFAKLPSILTIHLKRFEYGFSGSSLGMSKIHCPILTPSHLKLGTYCTEDCEQKNHKYELYGIIVHEGASLDSGHYVAYVRAPQDYPFLRQFCSEEEESSLSPPSSPSKDSSGVDIKVIDLETSDAKDKERRLLSAHAEYAHTGKWIRFNDSHVTLMTEEEVSELFLPEKTDTMTPYLLFYKLTDIDYSETVTSEKCETNNPDKQTKANTEKQSDRDSSEHMEEAEEDVSR